jgi:hypothetical protein
MCAAERGFHGLVRSHNEEGSKKPKLSVKVLFCEYGYGFGLDGKSLRKLIARPIIVAFMSSRVRRESCAMIGLQLAWLH